MEFKKELLEKAFQDYCKNRYAATNITFWDFKIFNAENEEITINNRETKKIKQKIEFKLIDSLSDYLNND